MSCVFCHMLQFKVIPTPDSQRGFIIESLGIVTISILRLMVKLPEVTPRLHCVPCDKLSRGMTHKLSYGCIGYAGMKLYQQKARLKSCKPGSTTPVCSALHRTI
jgi:hypothetical protein